MGLDYGSKTVGVAVSDPLGITAQGVETICRKDENKLRKTCARIEALIEEYQVTKIVLGLPKHMNNDIGDRAEKSMAFGEMLKRRTGLEVVMWDERLTTVEAERTLIENKVRREDRKKYIDKIVAARCKSNTAFNFRSNTFCEIQEVYGSVCLNIDTHGIFSFQMRDTDLVFTGYLRKFFQDFLNLCREYVDTFNLHHIVCTSHDGIKTREFASTRAVSRNDTGKVVGTVTDKRSPLFY